MEKNNNRSDKLCNVIRDLYEKNENISISELFKLFEHIGHKFDNNIYNIFLINSRNVNDIDDIINLCIEKNIKFEESLYATIIKSYCLYLEVEKSERFLAFMKKNNIKLKQRTYTHFIRMYDRLCNYDKLFQIYNEIKFYNIKLLSIDYITLINSFLKEGSIEKITKLVQDIENNDICFNECHINLLKQIFKNNRLQFFPTILTEEGFCEINECNLKPINITHNDRIEMMVHLDIQITDSKLKLFKKFKQWLYNHSDINIVIDGANVGYFNNRPNKGNSINFKQIDNVRTELTKMGNNVVIILHKRHTKKMSKSQNMLYKNWMKNNQIYITPVGINDDIFWLYTSLYSSSYIITNDRMRDHHFNISYNKIVKWKKKNIINYEISKNLPKLFFPKKYSETFQNLNKYTCFFPFNNKENKLQWFFTKIK